MQIAASIPGLRPRELDRTARRDLLASLRRRELALSGIDVWIPPEHFDDPAHADRAVSAVRSAVELAADLGRVPVSLALREESETTAAIIAHGQRHGIEIADHSLPLTNLPGAGVGIDPAACISLGHDPARIVHESAGRLVCARLVDLLRSGMRGPPGLKQEGRLDITEYKVALSVNCFRRPVVIDARQWSSPWQGVQQALEVWHAA